MWQEITVHIIVLFATIYSLYHGIKFFLPSGTISNDSSKCPGCSGGCSPRGSSGLSGIKQAQSEK